MRDLDDLNDTEPGEVLVLTETMLSRGHSERRTRGVFGNKTALSTFLDEETTKRERAHMRVVPFTVRHD